MFEKVMRQVEGKRRLADAVRPGEDQRMRQLARAVCGGKHAYCLRMADEPRRFRRFGNAV